MVALSLTELEDNLRAMMSRAAASAQGMKHTVWECHRTISGDVTTSGFLIYRSHPKPETPVVVWIDEAERRPMLVLVGSTEKKTTTKSWPADSTALVEIEKQIAELISANH